MAPPAAANSPRPPMGVWVGALGKLGWAIIKDEKETINNKMLITLINSPIIISLYYTPPVLSVYTQKNPSKRRVFIVAGAGFEPATSGL